MRRTAVVIDDSRVIRIRLRTELTNLGFQVVAEAERGDQALELYEKHRPALVMLDIILPEMDGVTAATQLLQKHPEATVVMCSSLTARDKILACRAAGVKYFILKPFTAESLATMVRRVFGLELAQPQLAED
ncbi:response regulator [Hyalangium gracile]|uniref:response regulator n=1 Tax=Hyalangium gracile TaxID=394092 RepID=UPI001CCF0E63|nr:response regulator [Hyalangium gracile]